MLSAMAIPIPARIPKMTVRPPETREPNELAQRDELARRVEHHSAERRGRQLREQRPGGEEDDDDDGGGHERVQLRARTGGERERRPGPG
jgi:hypothetical protein